MKVKVSIIVPNYNHGLYLNERLDSIFKQSFQDFEVILLDDASTDDSIRILNKYAKSTKVSHFLVNEVNSGSPFVQWRRGIEYASGEFIWIAESDDFSDHDFLLETMNIAEQQQDVGLIFTDSHIVNGSGASIGKASKFNKVLSKYNDVIFTKIEDRNMVLNNFISNLIIWNASSVLFKTEVIKIIDLNFLQTLKNAGDLFTYISIALKNDIIYLNKPLNYYRSHVNNTTKTNIRSGVLFSDRQTIMAYFIKELHALEGSKLHLNSFFKRNFLSAVDFKLYNKVYKLLRTYYNYKIISLYTYCHLTLYICCSRVFGKAPNKYRSYIKKVLTK